MFVGAATEPDSLCMYVSFMLHSHWPWLSAALLVLPLFHCTHPVIACQINVPLCSRAQKLFHHIQPLLPSLPLDLVLFNAAPLLHLPSALSFPSLRVRVHAHIHPRVFSLLFSLWSSHILPSQQFCLLCPLPGDEDNVRSSVSARPSSCMCLSFLTLMFPHKSFWLS